MAGWTWWKRGALLGAAMLAAFLAVSLAFPLGNSSADSRLRMLYLPGLLPWALVARPGIGAPLHLILHSARILTPAFYGLCGFAVGALVRNLRVGAVACAALLVAALVGALTFDIVEKRSRIAGEEAQRQSYWEQAQEIVRRNPADVHAHFMLGHYARVYYGNPEMAVQEFERVLSLEDEHPTSMSLYALMELALVEKQAGRASRAEEHYGRFRQLVERVECPDSEREMLRILEREYAGGLVKEP